MELENKSRRDFIAKSGVLAAGLALGSPMMSAASYKRIIGANERVRTGFIGIGNRGSQLMHLFMEHADAEVAAL